MSKVLEGIRIIDWTQAQAGPYAGALLADLGAEVIHVEYRGRGDLYRGVKKVFSVPMNLQNGTNWGFEDFNRGKRGIAVDLSKPEGQGIIHKLIKISDVFMSNLRKPERYDLDYKTVSRINSKIIYAYGSIFGEKGPENDQPGGFELAAYARSGAMTSSGAEGMPPVHLTPGLGDRVTSLCLANGILAALLARERLGIAQRVSVSILGSMIAVSGYSILPALLLGKEYERFGPSNARNPIYNWYKCKDQKWIAITSWLDRFWVNFCKAIGMPELAVDKRFEHMEEREANRGELLSILDKVFASRTCAEWVKSMHDAEVLCTPIQNVTELANDQQVLANNYLIDWEHPILGTVKWVGFPWDLSETPASFQSRAPEYGEHTEDILVNLLGYPWEEIERLKDSKVI